MFVKRAIWFVLLLLAIGCTAGGEDTVVLIVTENAVVRREPVERLAPVSSAQLTIAESFPVQVTLRVEGQFADDCTDIVRVDQARGGNTFAVEVIALSPRSADAICLPVPTMYSESVSLNVDGLLAGTYTVNVNGNIQAFTLAADNMLQAPTPEPIVPTADAAESSSGAFTLTGQVWHDVCAVSAESSDTPQASAGCVSSDAGGFVANGVLDADEPPLVGVELSIGLGACPGGEPFAMAAANEAGMFTFANLHPGTYCVGIPIANEPNATLLIPGVWTTPNADGWQTVEISADTELLPFGWDYKFLPNPDTVTFDPTAEPGTILNDPGCIHLAAFDGDVTIPDDSIFEPNTPIQKVWRFINTGSCGWGAGYMLRFVDGDLMNASTSVPIEDTILPGEALLVAVDMVAPQEPGSYQGNWMFAAPNDELFGIGGEDLPVWVRLEVVEPGTLGTITGFVWNDLCDSTDYIFGVSALPAGCFLNENGTIRGDGVYQSATETGLANVMVELGTGECGDAEPVTRVFTDVTGQYKFESLFAGTYCVFVEVLTESNYPILIPGDFTAPSPGRGGITIELTVDQDVESADFGWDFAEETEE